MADTNASSESPLKALCLLAVNERSRAEHVGHGINLNLINTWPSKRELHNALDAGVGEVGPKAYPRRAQPGEREAPRVS